MKIEDLNFTGQNNACLSFKVISEKIRTGEWTLLDANTDGGMITVQVIDQNSKVPGVLPLKKLRHLGIL